MSATNTRPRPSLHQDTGGAVYVEFLVAFIPFFILVLGMMQLALLYSAHLVVQHAAASAARAAIVVFPDCPARYDGAPENVVNGGGRGDDPASALGSIFGAGAPPGGIGLGGSSTSGGARLDAVRFAAGFPLVATSPSLDELTHDRDPRRQGIYDAIGGTTSPAVRLALGALAYNNVAMAVTFPRSVRESQYLDRFSNSRADLTTRVTYLFHCGVPIVSKMACDDALQLFTNVPLEQIRQATQSIRAGRGSIRDVQIQMDTVQAARERLQAAQPGLDELSRTGVGSSLSAVLLGLTGGHYYVIRAEATLPLQGIDRRITGACYNASRSR